MKINIGKTNILVVAIAAICLIAGSLQAQVIYQDDFSGGGGELGGTTPDISLTGATWVTANSRANGGTDIGAVQIFGDDGSILKDGGNAQYDAGALLSLSLAANTIYTLEATVLNADPTSGWVAIGFAAGDRNLDGSNGRHTAGSLLDPRGFAWALTRNLDGGTDQEIFNGPGTGNPFAAGDIVSPLQDVTFQVVLNTADVNALTADYFFNGTQVGSTQTLDDTAFNNINFVGITSDGGVGQAAASISNFSLTAEAIPEPGSCAVVSLIGLLATFRRRRV